MVFDRGSADRGLGRVRCSRHKLRGTSKREGVCIICYGDFLSSEALLKCNYTCVTTSSSKNTPPIEGT